MCSSFLFRLSWRNAEYFLRAGREQYHSNTTRWTFEHSISPLMLTLKVNLKLKYPILKLLANPTEILIHPPSRRVGLPAHGTHARLHVHNWQPHVPTGSLYSSPVYSASSTYAVHRRADGAVTWQAPHQRGEGTQPAWISNPVTVSSGVHGTASIATNVTLARVHRRTPPVLRRIIVVLRGSMRKLQLSP